MVDVNPSRAVFALAGGVFTLGALACWEGCSSFDATNDVDASALDAPVAPADGGDAATDARRAEALLVAQIDGGALGAVFAAGPGGVAWSVDKTLWSRTPLGAPTPTYSSTDPITPHVVISPADLFVSRPRSDSVIRCRLGEACTAPATTTTLEGAGPLSLDLDTLFIAELTSSRMLLSCSASSCVSSLAFFSKTAMPEGVVSIAASSAYVVAVTSAGTVLSYTQGSDGVELKGPGAVSGLANDGSNAYWIDATRGVLVRNPVGMANAPVESPFSVVTARDLVRERDRLYWFESMSGKVRRCKLPGFTEPEVVWTRATATRMALGDRIYLAEDPTGAIYAVEKPSP